MLREKPATKSEQAATKSEQAATKSEQAATKSEQPESKWGKSILLPASKYHALFKDKPAPQPLLGGMLCEGEVFMLFAPSNVGKSTLGLQWALRLAHERVSVRHVNFEMAPEWVDNVMGSEMTEELDAFLDLNTPDLFAMFSLDEKLQYLNETIEQQKAMGRRPRVLILDNLSIMGATSNDAEEAKTFMLALRKLSEEHGITIILVGHSRKLLRDGRTNGPITQDDFNGSKMYFNYVRSSAALNFGKLPSTGERVVYLKTLKCQFGPHLYPDSAVLAMRIVVSENGWRHFEELGTYPEWELIKDAKSETEKKNGNYEQLLSLLKQGMSVTDIAHKLNKGDTTVRRYITDLFHSPQLSNRIIAMASEGLSSEQIAQELSLPTTKVILNEIDNILKINNNS